MPRDVISALVAWCNKGNPSSSYASAKEAAKMMDDLRNTIDRLCDLRGQYKIIFTSGASEANSAIIRAVVDNWVESRRPGLPHLVISAIEHKSIMLCVDDLVRRGRATASLVRPNTTGHISVADVEREISPNTAMVAVMHANNETGAINDVAAIGAMAHRHGVPFYSDTVQAFGKIPLRPFGTAMPHVDGFCISFHKLCGPPGVGALVIHDSLAELFRPLIYGTQNGGLRGGTENVPGLGASFKALQLTMTDRAKKNATMAQLRDGILIRLAKMGVPIISYPGYLAGHCRQFTSPFVVALGGFESDIGQSWHNSKDYLPNTILLSVVRWAAPSICNAKFKERLACAGIIVSIGSACNTSSDKASHVLDALGADTYIRAGALRISLGDDSTSADAVTFVQEFYKIFREL